jgi:Concanavalin A-like lectin/glucanases superfamily
VLSRPGARSWAIAVFLTIPAIAACTRSNPAFTAARPADASPADRRVADVPADPPAPDVTVSPDIISDFPGPEAPPPDATPDLVDAPPPLVADCPAVPELALCLRFENNPIRDESPNATAVSLTSVRVDPEVDGRAAFLTSGSKIQVAESAALASPSITIEAWVKPSALPQDDNVRASIIDYSRQYALVIEQDGEVRCRVNTGGSSYIDISRIGLLQVGIWSSVACTVHNGQYALWHNGVAVATQTISGPLVARNTTEPFLVGSNFPTSANPDTDPFLGHVDNVRIWRRLRTPEEICRGAYGCTP